MPLISERLRIKNLLSLQGKKLQTPNERKDCAKYGLKNKFDTWKKNKWHFISVIGEVKLLYIYGTEVLSFQSGFQNGRLLTLMCEHLIKYNNLLLNEVSFAVGSYNPLLYTVRKIIFALICSKVVSLQKGLRCSMFHLQRPAILHNIFLHSDCSLCPSLTLFLSLFHYSFA